MQQLRSQYTCTYQSTENTENHQAQFVVMLYGYTNYDNTTNILEQNFQYIHVVCCNCQVMEIIKYWDIFLCNYKWTLYQYLEYGFSYEMKFFFFMKRKTETILNLKNEKSMSLFDLGRFFNAKMTHNGTVLKR